MALPPRDSKGRFTKKGGGVEVASLFGTLGLNIDRASWKQADQQLEGLRGAIANGLAKASQRVEGLLGGLGTKIAAAFGAAGLVKLSDTYTGLENRLRQVAQGEEHLQELMQRTKTIADETRSDWHATGEAYVRLTNATKELGLSEERRLKILETLNMALQSSGATASEAAAGTLQLMQGLSAGALQGDEFRSIAEQLPDLLDLFAKEMGVSRGQLKKLGAEGKITSKVVIASLENASETIRERFAKSTATAGQLWTVFKNQLTEAAGQIARNTRLLDALKTVFDGLVALIPVAVDGITWVAEVLHDLFQFLSSGTDEAVAALIGIAVAIGSVVVPALYSMAAGWVAALAPILAVVAAAGLVALGIIKLVKHWDKVRAVGVRAWKWIERQAIRFWNWAHRLPQRFVQVMIDFGAKIVEAFDRVWRIIKQGAEDAFSWVSRQARKIPVLGWLGEKIGQGAAWIAGARGDVTPEELTAIDVINGVRNPFATPAVAPAAAGPVHNVNVGPTTVNVHAAPGMSEERIGEIAAQEARRQLDNALRAED